MPRGAVTKYTYDDYTNFFDSHDCKLITTKEEYESTISKDSFKKFTIEYKCKHQKENVYFHMFKSRKSGSRCFECKPVKAPKIDYLDIEHKSFLLFEPYIKDHFDFVRCCESCKCDYIIKPKSVSEDKFIPIQLKSTETKVFNQYKFDIKDKYTIEAILCICIDEERYWLFDKAPDVTRINIGISKTRGKYIKNEVPKEKLKDELMKLYETSQTYSKEFLNKPSTPEVALEIEYKKSELNQLNV